MPLALASELVGSEDARRLLEPIGNIPPAEAEAHFCASNDLAARAA